MTKHTPTPWRAGPAHKDGSCAIHAKTASVFHLSPFTSSFHDAEANAAFIIKACNLHDELVEALEKVAEGAGPFNRDPLLHCSNTVDAMKDIAKAALAKAKGDDINE